MHIATPDGTHPSACPICGTTGGREILTARDHRRGTRGEFRVVECASCRLARTDPWPDDFGAWYPDEYPQHSGQESITARASSAALSRAARPGARRLGRVIARAVPSAETGGHVAAGSRILDVGAGTGAAVAAFRAAGHDAWGVEPSLRAVLVAESRGTEGVVAGSLDDALDNGLIPDGPYDIIRMSQVLEHVADPIALLKRIRGIIAPSGRLVVDVPNLDSLARRATGGAWDGLELPRHLVHYTRESLLWVLSLGGFHVTSLRTAPLLGVLAGSIDARTAGGDRQRGWSDALPVRVALYPVEWALGAVGQGDGIVAIAEPAGT
jgi:SAM-dependent methyltransferase